MLARATGKETRFGEQFAELAFTGSFSAALPQYAEFL
jgi:hypothetical protein